MKQEVLDVARERLSKTDVIEREEAASRKMSSSLHATVQVGGKALSFGTKLKAAVKRKSSVGAIGDALVKTDRDLEATNVESTATSVTQVIGGTSRSNANRPLPPVGSDTSAPSSARGDSPTRDGVSAHTGDLTTEELAAAVKAAVRETLREELAKEVAQLVQRELQLQQGQHARVVDMPE
jgi:hypothetical protein